MSKDLNFYLKLDYPFNVRPDFDDGGYIVEFQDLQFCVGTGDTVEEAIKDALIAKEQWIKAAFENMIPIPFPTIIEDKEDYSGRITLRIPKSLHKLVIDTAKKEGVSANQFLSHLISMGIGKKSI
ncbi:type II toxin-antitoxin system HicB family antitoxin [Desulfotomaculum sp. 1211_IL3151]|uniref:type II toxin-antitoxin system HicB family antitoxin n=1 Tax=Desulfotomaculum sp. 1211_IL3151 TaxID=3084055 RepID=UPI002FDB2132